MTASEMKENLAKKCKDSWEIYKIYRRVFGMSSVPAEKMQTAWYNYDSLYREFLEKKLNINYICCAVGVTGRKEITI